MNTSGDHRRGLHLVATAAAQPDGELDPDLVLHDMLDQWCDQQASRACRPDVIRARRREVLRFAEAVNDYPWAWTPHQLEEWTADKFSIDKLAHSTVRKYHGSLALFVSYLRDPRNGWIERCASWFGATPQEICHDWNTVSHVSDYEGRPIRRPFTRQELQDLFDCADDEVVRLRHIGRKGWLSAYRDATALKVAYAWGLRRTEAAKLDLADWRRNPNLPDLESFGVLHVRYGKAKRNSPPKPRTVITVHPWAVEAVQAYLAEIRPLYRRHAALATMWPTERGSPVSPTRLSDAFRALADQVGVERHLGLHCLRHSYATHLIEDGWDPYFVQRQLGHEWASTTAIYVGLTDDFSRHALLQAQERLLRSLDTEDED